MNLFFHLNFDQCRISNSLSDDFIMEASFYTGKISNQNGECLLSAKSRNSLSDCFGLSFNIHGKTRRRVTLKPKNIFSPTKLMGKFDGNEYSIKTHLGFKYSIFENGIQIAFLDKTENSLISRPIMKLAYNSNINKELLIGLVFYVLRIRTNGFDGRELTYNIYSKHKHDKNWKVIR